MTYSSQFPTNERIETHPNISQNHTGTTRLESSCSPGAPQTRQNRFSRTLIPNQPLFRRVRGETPYPTRLISGPPLLRLSSTVGLHNWLLSTNEKLDHVTRVLAKAGFLSSICM